MWYSSFWSEGPKNHRNLKILVSKFVPRGFEARRTWGFEARRHGVSRGGAGVSRHGAKGFRGTAPWGFEGRRHCSHCSHCTHLAPSLEVPSDYQGPRGTAPNDKSLKCFIIGAAPRNPMAPRLETPWRRASKPLRRPSKPHGAAPRNPRCAAPQNPWGQILRPKFSSFGGF